jgi:hypothetical protein
MRSAYVRVSDDAVEHCAETVGIVHVPSVIEPERLLVEVSKQMKRFHGHIRAAQTALQQPSAPRALTPEAQSPQPYLSLPVQLQPELHLPRRIAQ